MIVVTGGLSLEDDEAGRRRDSSREDFGYLLFMDDFKKAFILSTI
jgi:hypothetical protein